MEYTVLQLSRISGLTPRAIRHYDEINLLKPHRVSEKGYRIYNDVQVNILQQIMFYRELDLPLDEIKRIVTNKNFNLQEALSGHLKMLTDKREYLDNLIESVKKTILHYEGEYFMSNDEKFKAFKEKMVKENTEKYGDEILEKYGEETVKKSNEKFMNMTPEQHERINNISNELMEALKSILKNGDNGERGKKCAALHKEWLTFFWDEYSKDAHIGLTEMYLADERFKAHYDKNAGEGAAEALRDAVSKNINEI